MPTLQGLEAELEAQNANLREIDEILAIMPDSQDALDMKREVLISKQATEKQIAILKPSEVVARAASPGLPTAEPHDDGRTTAAAAARGSGTQEERRMFKVNETVSAKYAADKQFYPATVVSVMGSAHAPVYTVKYTGYNETATVRGSEIRPAAPPASAQKRKADGTPAVASPAASPEPTAVPAPAVVDADNVLSAPANIDTALAESLRKQATGKDANESTGTEKPHKKVKTNKALDKAKNSWQDWQKRTSGGKIAKVANKESMFRTGESHAARVGFTGSGKEMTKDADRARHVFDTDKEAKEREGYGFDRPGRGPPLRGPSRGKHHGPFG